MDGIHLLQQVKAEYPHTEVIIMTGKSTEEIAIRALKSGASDYFHKPIKGPEVLASLLRSERILHMRAQNTRLQALVTRLSGDGKPEGLFGQSEASQHLVERLRRVALSPDTTVLLIGETGSGKEIAARLLHQLTFGKAAPFVAINCGGIAESLLERELFGHERGAFTGAESRTPGVFEMGLGGTVLLDEVTEMSFAAQSRLLRVLEDRTLRRLGGTTDIALGNTRVVATTNKDIAQLVADGSFREDLYFRLNVVPLHLPPLRERRSEIPHLASYFLARADRKLQLSPAAEAQLMNYDFPGNIRELKNLVEYAAIFCAGDTIEATDLAPSLQSQPRQGAGVAPAPTTGTTGSLSLVDNEILLIQEALRRNPNNHSATARALGITPQALYRKLKKFGLA
jgi:DNA-binding NtrC family response regulator